MSGCADVCRLCKRLVISQSVSYDSGVLTVNIPAGSYNDGEKYCIIVAQSIPDSTIINAPVMVTIGTGTVQYPLLSRSCAQVTAAGLRTRTRYATRVATSASGGSFRLIGKASCAPDNRLTSINGTTA